jgi:hypothetical protein
MRNALTGSIMFGGMGVYEIKASVSGATERGLNIFGLSIFSSFLLA